MTFFFLQSHAVIGAVCSRSPWEAVVSPTDIDSVFPMALVWPVLVAAPLPTCAPFVWFPPPPLRLKGGFFFPFHKSI